MHITISYTPVSKVVFSTYGENDSPCDEHLVPVVNVIMMNSFAIVTKSNAKATNSVAKLVYSIANGTNSTAKVTNPMGQIQLQNTLSSH